MYYVAQWCLTTSAVHELGISGHSEAESLDRREKRKYSKTGLCWAIPTDATPRVETLLD